MFSSFENFKRIRKRAEENRTAEGRRHEVLYFHKVDDPYSHLTAHYIEKFKDAYDPEQHRNAIDNTASIFQIFRDPKKFAQNKYTEL